MGDILIAIGMAWFVASLMLRPDPRALAAHEAADSDDLDDSAAVDVAAA